VNDITGAGWTTFGTQGIGTKEINLPQGVAVDSAGHIYMADSLNYRVVRVDDMTGSGWVSYGTQGGGTGQFLGPVGVAVDAAFVIDVADKGSEGNS
jgi:hypothetical protein